ncbi:hypothetical protein IQ37_13480 [Chryseobacterium piperi]|uniref:Uncharacterized protein n=1 Tax=Chryseobacterium piperi TaxID=558152 RepID=A0A086B5L5_9FLAO|nr:hypothetical protein [Chryseobacterium piperi]ASW75620.1 hypothetical protein CJF12_15905 [Chryseobacterium piperi]KFF24229.1 hypothetical protein IQ37_13480 [Chryseobacterium piperi]
MKLILSLIPAFMLFFQTSDLEALRNSYAKANQSNANTQAFITIAEKQSASDPVTVGYKAAAQIMEAKVTTEKGKRKTFVKTGATSLENVIKNNPNTIELRVIRLSVQENIPKIVGYHSSLKDDKTFILNNYNKQNSALKSYIQKFAAQSKTFSPAEKASLK